MYFLQIIAKIQGTGKIHNNKNGKSTIDIKIGKQIIGKIIAKIIVTVLLGAPFSSDITLIVSVIYYTIAFYWAHIKLIAELKCGVVALNSATKEHC